MAGIFDIFKSIENERKSVPVGAPEFVVAMLGNPGREYLRTRHNAGFMCAEYYSEKNNVKIDRVKFKSLTAEVIMGGKKTLLLLPQTFMNNSGEAVRDAMDYYKLDMKTQFLVIYDDIYLDVGKLRIREKGSAGGHNGIKSIIEHTNTDEFQRIRMGVGKLENGWSMPDWVLGNIPKQDQENFFDAIPRALAAAELMVAGKLNEAMNKYNG